MPDPWMMVWVTGNQVEVWPNEETSVRKLKMYYQIS